MQMLNNKHKVISILVFQWNTQGSKSQEIRIYKILMVGDGRNEIYMEWVWSFISKARSYETIHETVRMIHSKLSHEEAHFFPKKEQMWKLWYGNETQHFIKGSDLWDMISMTKS